jgi:thiamine biosynthesis lipoprotein
VLQKAGVVGAVLDLGGQVLAVGSDANERPWRVPVADPRDRQKTVAELGLTSLSASTSGNSERSRTVEGRRIGHILDPRTGEPAADFGSATVVAPSALVADILSTAFFVLGPEKGLALSAALRRKASRTKCSFSSSAAPGSRPSRAPASPASFSRPTPVRWPASRPNP